LRVFDNSLLQPQNDLVLVLAAGARPSGFGFQVRVSGVCVGVAHEGTENEKKRREGGKEGGREGGREVGR
jgi:hypothetical protein